MNPTDERDTPEHTEEGDGEKAAGMGVSSERDENEVQEVGERAHDSERPSQADQRADEGDGEWIDTDAMAVDALDDDTRTHLDEPGETEDVQTNPGPVQHGEPGKERG